MADIKRVQQLIRPEIQALSAYHVPDASNMLKLDAMENPYQWPDNMKQAWSEEIKKAELNRYPDPHASAVKQQLKRVMNIPDHQQIMLGNGSDEIIQILAMAVAKPGCSILAPEPGFVMYKMIGTFTGMNYIGVPLANDFSLDMPVMLAAIKEHQPALIFLAVPNNPTGNVFSEANIKEIAEAAEGLVVIDEAYMAFTDADHVPLLDQFDNVLVMRTLSKVGLAGLRLGFLIGHPDWLNELEKIRLPYNINILTQVSAEFSLANYDVLKEQTQDIRQQRELLFNALKELDGIEVWPSEANFILARTTNLSAKEVFENLKQHGVLIKCLHGAHELLDNCLRITVASAAENAAFLTALKASL